MKEIEFSKIRNHNIVEGTIGCEEYFSQVKGGEFKPEVEDVRKLLKEGKLSEANLAKNKLPATTPSGVFNERKDKAPPVKYSQLIALDNDKLSGQGIRPEELKEKLKDDPFVLAVHLSCSGDGMVIWVHHNGKVEDHPLTVDQIADRFESRYDLKIDRRAGKSINALRYASYDPDLFVNWSAQQYHVIDPKTYSAIKKQAEFTMKKESPEEGNRNNFLFQFACNSKRAGIDETELISYSIINFEDKDFKANEISTTVKSAYKQEQVIKSTHVKTKNLVRIKGAALKTMQENEAFLKQKKTEDIKAQEPIFIHNGIPIVFPNSIVLVQGKSGSFKSSVSAAFASTGIHVNKCGPLPLGLGVTMDQLHVIYIDTERNLTHQFPLAIQKIQEHACIAKEEDPENFSYTSLVNIKRSDRYDAITEYIQDIRDKVGKDKHLVIIIDVVSDLVLTFNDPAESLTVCDFFNDLINTENCTIITVLHENPSKSNDKARGHLGTELNNKASTVLQVSTVPGVPGTVKVAVQKSRNTAIPDPIYGEFDEATGGLKPINPASLNFPKSLNTVKADLTSVVDYLSQNLLKPKIRKEFLEDLTNHFNCGIRTIEPKISEIIVDNIVIPTVNGDMELRKEKRSDGVYYFLTEPKKLEADATAA